MIVIIHGKTSDSILEGILNDNFGRIPCELCESLDQLLNNSTELHSDDIPDFKQ